MSVSEVSTPMTDDQLPEKASFIRVVRDQRKISLVAFFLMVSS